MLVTDDKYELPIVVADTVYELAIKTGQKERSVRASLDKSARGEGNHIWQKVKIKEG